MFSPDRAKYWKENGVRIFDEITSKREKPSLILPRGIGAKHFCSVNACNGYSASCVDFYVCNNNKSYINNLWLFLNSTLFWLIREISGRKSLGGGMLKSEAVDLKQFPIYFDFECDNEIETLQKESIGYKVANAVEEELTPLHSKIDNLVFEKLNIPINMQQYIYDAFNKAFNARYNKSIT